MPNFLKHATTGALVGSLAGLTVGYFDKQKNTAYRKRRKTNAAELLGFIAEGAFVGTIGGILPDIIEPATNPRHRKFFHSLTTGGTVCYGLHRIAKSRLPKNTKRIFTTASLGYLSHLYLDSNTPIGLPFF